MKVGIDELREAAGETAETAEAAKEATETVSTGPETKAGSTASNAIQEFVEIKRAEKELEEVMSEDSGGGLSDAIGELLKDPEVRMGLKQVLKGSGEGGSKEEAQYVESEQSEPQPFEDGESDASEADTFDKLHGVLQNVATEQPNMTAKQMLQYAEENEEILRQEL